MKNLISAVFLIFVLSASPVFADYSIVLKNESGTVIHTYPVTTVQVEHLQKNATVTGKSVVNQIKEAILDIIAQAKKSNKARWQDENDAFIDEESRRP